MTLSKDDLKPEELLLLEQLQSLLEKTSQDFENTLGDTRKASSVRIAGLTHEVDMLRKDFQTLKKTFYSFRDLIDKDDPTQTILRLYFHGCAYFGESISRKKQRAHNGQGAIGLTYSKTVWSGLH